MKAKSAVIDGEIVALDAKGRPSFQVLQHRSAHAEYHIVVYAFDPLHLDGLDLTNKPLSVRRAKLLTVLDDSGLPLSVELPGDPADIVAAVREMGLEGIVAKRKDSVYEPGERRGAWQKLKLELQQEFVVGGYRPSNNGLDAPLIGYYSAGRLMFASKVRAGSVPQVSASGKAETLQAERCRATANDTQSKPRKGAGLATKCASAPMRR